MNKNNRENCWHQPSVSEDGPHSLRANTHATWMMPPEGIEPPTRFFRETCSATELRGHLVSLLYVLFLQPGANLLVQFLQLRHGKVKWPNFGWVRHGFPGRSVIGRNPEILREYLLLSESLSGEAALPVHMAMLENLLRENRTDSRLGQWDGRRIADGLALLVSDASAKDAVVWGFPLPPCPSMGQADSSPINLV